LRQLPAAFIAAKNKTVNPNAWVWCLQIQVDSQTDDGFFITGNNEPVTLGSDVYDPYPLRVDEMSEGLEGAESGVNIIINDVVSDFMAYVIPGEGLIGNNVLMTLVNLEDLNSTYVLDFKINSIRARGPALNIQLVAFNTFDRGLGNLTYQRNFCRWDFTGEECGVDPSVPLAGEICTKRLQGTFGCEYWGDREALAAFPKLHPMRFGAFPSLITGRSFEV